MIVLFAVFVDVWDLQNDSHLENGAILVKFHDT